MTRLALGLVLVTPPLLSGCTTDGSWSMSRMLGWDDTPSPCAGCPRPIWRPRSAVETIGRKIIAQNTFTGIEPLFHTIGVHEPVLFHEGPERLMVSEGLVKQCRTDGEIAGGALLRTGEDGGREKVRPARRRGTRLVPGNRRADGFRPGRAARRMTPPAPRSELSLRSNDQTSRSRTPTTPLCRPADLLRGAGFDPADLDRVAPLLKQSDRGLVIKKQLSGSAPAPRWEWWMTGSRRLRSMNRAGIEGVASFLDGSACHFPRPG